MTELLVVADDLTGATDTGVQFAGRGIPTRVIGSPTGDVGRFDGDSTVLVVDTRSRHVAPDEAARRVERVTVRAREAGIRRFFKKTDSTLRGNLGSELQALLAGSGERLLAFVPALPSLGRTTRGGVQFVHGHALHLTEFGADPLEPVRAGSIPDLLRLQTDLPIAVVDFPALSRLRRSDLPGRGILVFDAESDGEMRRVVDWLDREELLSAVAGTAALGQRLAEHESRWAERGEPSVQPDTYAPPMLVLAGSLHPVSAAQVEHAARHGFSTLAPDPLALTAPDPLSCPAGAAVVRSVVDLLNRGRNVILRGARGPRDVQRCLELGAARGMSAGALHLLLAENLGRLGRQVLLERPLDVLVVFGGDTLAGLIDAFGNPALIPRRELLDGVPICEMERSERPLVVSKAGGFGEESLLVECLDRLSWPVHPDPMHIS